MTSAVRRVVAGASALLVLHSAVLRAGMVCGTTPATPAAAAQAHDVQMTHAAHAAHTAGAPAPAGDGRAPTGHHGDTGRCALMAACAIAGLTEAPPSVVSAARPHDAVRPAAVAALASVTTAPETPPPRA